MKGENRQTYCGLYHFSRPVWISWPACSGVMDLFITAAVTRQSSFSRFGSPRERIWYELRMVDLHSCRQLRNSLASGSSNVTLALLSGKKPGRAFAYSLANSSEATQLRKVLASSGWGVLAFIPMAI